MSVTSKVPVGFTTTRFEGICDQYSYTLEQEPWYLLSMNAADGAWKVEVQYEDPESMFGDATRFTVATLAEDYVREEVLKGRWGAYDLQNGFEVSVVVPEHVAILML